MNTRGFAAMLVGLCLATCAEGDERLISDQTLSSHGVTYRIIGVNSFYLVTPLGGSTVPLRPEESLARCDQLVAAVAARATAGGRPVRLVRDRIYTPAVGSGWVDYSQRHQGYRIAGAGARVNRDENGRIFTMGLQCESKDLPIFAPRDTTRLLKVAAGAVPHRITGRPVRAELMIDPGGEAPPRLIYFVLFPVRFRGRDGGWQVDVDAVSGAVLRSVSTVLHMSEDRGPEP